jgi:hypothetical protein
MNLRLCSASLLLALLTACSGIAVDSDYDPEVDFSALHSYAWIDGVPPQTAELVQGNFLVLRVRAAVDPWLEQNGYALTTEPTVDFLVHQQVVTRERVEAWTSSYGSTSGHPWWNGLPIYTDTTFAIYPESILVLDFLAPDGERLLWRGIGELNSFGADTPQERALRVRETVEAILAQFPPKQE